MRSGRTIGEKREKLETASERTATHKRLKRQQFSRIATTIVGFALVGGLLVYLGIFFTSGVGEESSITATTVVAYRPTIPVIDEASSTTSGQISSRMSEYIGMMESDLRELGIVPVKAVIPVDAIREVDFYIEGHNGYLKTILDRGTGVTAEDADRMLRYLAGQGIAEFQYIDVRIDNKAYWK